MELEQFEMLTEFEQRVAVKRMSKTEFENLYRLILARRLEQLPVGDEDRRVLADLIALSLREEVFAATRPVRPVGLFEDDAELEAMGVCDPE